jgi:hypothetical protein
MISIKYFSPISPQGPQSSPSQDPPSEKKTVLRYYNRRGENMADTICTGRRAARGMERKRRRLVGKCRVFIPIYN